MRGMVGKVFLAGIPEGKDAAACILACRGPGLRTGPGRAAGIYGC